ncbi:DUF6286 domain-containing protein [Streptomyces sp. NPDC101237]|uniref:DUF6286 domain-containing protein n=1 Tax=Streptomyces sp. NPDC101237 TaxID=3366139 RepID=UPI00380C42F8
MTPDPDPPTEPVTVPPAEERTAEPGPPGMRPTDGEPAEGHRTHRPWSARRLPAALVAALVLLASGAALVDVIAVRAGRPAAAWRRQLAHALATRPLDDVWMLTGAAVAAAAGLWLIVLALTPGLRKWLPLRSPLPGLRAVLDRNGAADLMRDAGLRVPGVGDARVRMGRHRVTARAYVRFRDPGRVKEDLTAVLDDERDRLALAHPPHIAVRVRRSSH